MHVRFTASVSIMLLIFSVEDCFKIILCSSSTSFLGDNLGSGSYYPYHVELRLEWTNPL